DVAPSAAPYVEPLVARRWTGYDVHFPAHRRRVEDAYAAVTSQRLHRRLGEVARREQGLTLFLGQGAAAVERHRVTLESGVRLEGELVVDARGPERASMRAGGFQKFVGLELAVEGGERLERPTLIDARVPQRDGFRFFYTLPLADDRVLVED